MKLYLGIALLVAGGCAVEPDPETEPVALAGPFQIVKHARSTRGAASLTDAEGSLNASDVRAAPDGGPFFAEASAGVTRGDISAAGVTIHDSALDGRRLRMTSHCDANSNVADTETQYASASCGNAYEVGFMLARPAKVTLYGTISSARTGLAGGWGVVALRDGTGALIAGIESDNDMLFETLSLPPGDYALSATGNGSAISYDFHAFSAATIDVEVDLRARTY